jgi:acetyltransferase-like isoleucine patch superfamily enzyme
MKTIKKMIALAGVGVLRLADKLFIRYRMASGRLEPSDLGPHGSIGRHSYAFYKFNICLSPSSNTPSVKIGNFCSIAPGIVILANADHPTNLPSTFPFRTQLFSSKEMRQSAGHANFDVITRGSVEIGHDVWIGLNAIILSGVTIGTGAVVGAGSVVTKSIPPYAIAAGNPARVVRFRFPPEIIEQMLKSEWWLLSDEQLKELEPFLYSKDIVLFLEQVSKIRASVK